MNKVKQEFLYNQVGHFFLFLFFSFSLNPKPDFKAHKCVYFLKIILFIHLMNGIKVLTMFPFSKIKLG